MQLPVFEVTRPSLNLVKGNGTESETKGSFFKSPERDELRVLVHHFIVVDALILPGQQQQLLSSCIRTKGNL